MTPILSTVTGLAKESKDIRRYVKTAVFQEAAVAAAGAESKQHNTSADIHMSLLPHAPACLLQLIARHAVCCFLCGCVVCSMVPAGSASESQLDVDPLSLRSLLLPLCTSINFKVKHAVSELLFQLCDEQGQHRQSRCGAGQRTAQACTAECRLTPSVSPSGCCVCCVLYTANEFIRLCGLGNAIGLLAEKGMPGNAPHNTTPHHRLVPHSRSVEPCYAGSRLGAGHAGPAHVHFS